MIVRASEGAAIEVERRRLDLPAHLSLLPPTSPCADGPCADETAEPARAERTEATAQPTYEREYDVRHAASVEGPSPSPVRSQRRETPRASASWAMCSERGEAPSSHRET